MCVVQARIVSAAATEAAHSEKAGAVGRQQALAAAPGAAKQQPAVTAAQQTPTREPAVRVQRAQQAQQAQQAAVQQPRFESPAGARPEAPRARHAAADHAGSSFFRDAVSELGQAPSEASLKKASQSRDLSFAAAATSELAPAPRMSALRARAQSAGPRTSRQQQLAAMTVTPHGQAPAGFTGRQYSLARESREGAEHSAYDFGRALESKRPRAHAAAAPRAAPAATRAQPAATRAQPAAAPARQPRFDRQMLATVSVCMF